MARRESGYGGAMRVRRAPAPLLAVLSLALGLAACSLDEDDQRAADNLEPALVTNDSTESERDAAGCVAEMWVGEVGTAPLVEDELLTRGLDANRASVREVLDGERAVSRRVAAGLARARLECADFDAISLDLERNHPRASAEDLDEYADCLKELDRDDWEKSLTAFFTGREARGLDGFRDDLRACNAMLEATDK